MNSRASGRGTFRLQKVWTWICGGCGRPNLRAVPGSTKGGEQIDVACRHCELKQSHAIAPASLMADRRKRPREAE